MKMKVNVVLVTYNRKNLLIEALDAVLNQTYTINKIFCIDNFSTDGTQDYLNEKGFLKRDNFIYIRTHNNLGGAGGFKLGVKEALLDKPDYIWLMDDDVEPEPTCLENLLSVSNEYGCVSQPVRYYSDGEFASFESKLFNFKNPFRDFKVGKISLEEIREGRILDICAVPFEGPLIPYEVILKVGEIDDSYFIIGDDTDYSKRIIDSGYKIKLVNSANLIRKLKINPGTDFNWKTYFYFRNITLLDKKFSSLWVLWLRIIYRFFRFSFSNVLYRRNINAYRVLISGLWAGIMNNKNNDVATVKKRYG